MLPTKLCFCVNTNIPVAYTPERLRWAVLPAGTEDSVWALPLKQMGTQVMAA